MLVVIKTLDIKRYVYIKFYLYDIRTDFSSSLAIEMCAWPLFFRAIPTKKVLSDNNIIHLFYYFHFNNIIIMLKCHPFISNCCRVAESIHSLVQETKKSTMIVQ